METDDPRRTARELALQASRDPALSQSELQQAFDLLETEISDDSAFEAAEIRKYAAETIAAVAYERPAAITEYTDRLITQIHTHQEVLTQSPVVYESTSLISTLLTVQASLLESLKEVGRTTPAALRESIDTLFPVFVEDGMFPDLTSTFLTLVDVIVINEDNVMDIDPSRFWGLVDSGTESLTVSALGVLQTLHEHGGVNVLSDRQTLVELLETGSPDERRAAAEFVKTIVVASNPDGIKELRAALEAQLGASNVEIRLSALFALLAFPNVERSAYEAEIERALALLADENPDVQKTAVDVFSDFIDVAPVTRAPIEPLVSVLYVDKRVTTISARILLGRLAELHPERVAAYIDELVKPIGNSAYSERSKFTALTIVYQLAMQDAATVIPVLSTVASEIGGSTAMHQGHHRRVKSQTALYSQATGADPQLRHISETFRSSRVFSSVVNRSGFDVDWEAIPEYLAVMIFKVVSRDEVQPVAEECSEIVSGLNSSSDEVRSSTMSILNSITESYSHRVSPHLGFILDSITHSDGDQETLDETDLRGLFVIFQTVIDSSETWWLSSRDLEKFFALLDAEFDDSVADPVLGRRLALRILTSLLFRLLIDSAGPQSSLEDDLDIGAEGANSDDTPSFDPDAIREEINEKRIQDLVALGETGSFYEREKVLNILYLVTPTSSEQIVPHVSTFAAWAHESAPDHTVTAGAAMDTNEDDTPLQGDETSENTPLGRLRPHLSSDLDTVRAKLSVVYMSVGIRQPTALIPVLDTLTGMAADSDPEVSWTALSALEEVVVAHRSLGQAVIEPVLEQLIHGDPKVEEEAAHLLSVAAEDVSERAAGELSVITVAFKQASSMATRVFLARSISIIAESYPGEILSISSHLVAELDADPPDALQQRSSEYTSGGANLLGADRFQNMALVRRFVLRALKHCLSIPGLTDEWSPDVLQDLIKRAPEIAPLAARRYVAHYETHSTDVLASHELADRFDGDLDAQTMAILRDDS